MKNIKILMVLLISTLFFSCGKKEEEKVEKIYKSVKVEPANVEVFNETVNFSGSLDSIDEVTQITETGGYVKKMNYKNGDEVRKGDIILVMEDKNVESAYLDTKSRVTSTKSDYDKQKLTFKKYDQLYKEKLISEEEFLNMKIKLAASKGNYESASAAYLRAKKDYNNLTVRAKLNGEVANLDFKHYQRVDPNMHLFKVVDNSKMRILGGVPGKDVIKLKNGAKAEVFVEDLKEAIEAQLYEINPVADPNTRKFQVRVRFDNPDGNLRAGMFSKVDLIVGKKSGVLVPKRAILIEELVSYIFLLEEVEENGKKEYKAKKIKVELGNIVGDKREVISDELKENNQVVVEGQFNIDNGSYVKIVE
jgi:RND family efflux transporter MFP subunit